MNPIRCALSLINHVENTAAVVKLANWQYQVQNVAPGGVKLDDVALPVGSGLGMGHVMAHAGIGAGMGGAGAGLLTLLRRALMSSEARAQKPANYGRNMALGALAGAGVGGTIGGLGTAHIDAPRSSSWTNKNLAGAFDSGRKSTLVGGLIGSGAGAGGTALLQLLINSARGQQTDPSTLLRNMALGGLAGGAAGSAGLGTADMLEHTKVQHMLNQM